MIKNDKSTAEETGVEVEGVDFMAKRVLSLLVDNTSGVLSRISGLFSRRGYNIDSITAGVTADPRFTRITIVTSGDQYILEQIEKQVSKLVDVRSVRALDPEESVYRELVMIKLKVSETDRPVILSVANIFRANIVDVATLGSRAVAVFGHTGCRDKGIALSKNRFLTQIRDRGAGTHRHHRTFQRHEGCPVL